ncbi:hypothetical protein JHK84_052325 [Glycine max]|uniref:Uncharacterized protein n=1 Tax=Glycine soja TaxID=3848 RepID=A0A445FC34_GLYSO|nr:hypothetical protein JHK86_052284 [Glycine max]KAG5082287.1 hypothetical protein JHK84_052325 [Glycine max]RZB46383.1 hypothetical protein D0Y65_050418 [Glycine soja]
MISLSSITKLREQNPMLLYSTFHILKSTNDNETEIELQLIHSEDQYIGPSASDFTPSPKQVKFAPTAAPMYPYLFDESDQLILTPLSDLMHFNSVEAEEASFIPSWEETKTIRDMGNDDCMRHLQVLWEELQPFGFDLTWLEPHVQSAMSAKAYFERVDYLKSIKVNIASLEIELKKLKTKLVVAQVDLEVARRDLPEVENDFRERDMDAELGYGIP